MISLIPKREIRHAQIALFVAIVLQFVVWQISGDRIVWPYYVLIGVEIILAVILGAVNRPRRQPMFYHFLALVLLALVSFANFSSLVIVLSSLIVGHDVIDGTELLAAAIAIFITNIIVYALWYWEIDSPGLSATKWTKNDKDFHFPQQDKDMRQEYPNWRPEFLDYLYLSVTNAVNFAPADSKPITHAAKLLMSSQALISVFTLALVIARSVSILGN